MARSRRRLWSDVSLYPRGAVPPGYRDRHRIVLRAIRPGRPRVFGMDNSGAMLDGARSKGFPQDLRDHDMMSVPYPYDQGTFDHAICVGVLQFFAAIDAILQEVGRVVRDGGVFGFTVADLKRDEPTSFTARGEHTQSDRDVIMYRHPEPGVRASLKAAGFMVQSDLEFVAFMDVARTAPMPMKAYVAQREPRS